MASSSSQATLARVLGPWMATALVIGTVIGSGVFKKPQAVADQVPLFGLAIAAWVLVGILSLIGALTLAEVAVLLPRVGGNYVFLREAYGRWAGFLWGWVEFWIIRSGSIAALATVFAESLHDILRFAQQRETVFEFWELRAITVTVIAVLAWINLLGTRLGGGVQLFITTVKVLSIVLLALLPFLVLGLVSAPRTPPSVDNLSPVWPADWSTVNWSKFGAAMVGVLWAYHGWMNIAPVAEEVREPSRNIPLALVVGTLAIIVLYVSVNVAYALVIPQQALALTTERTVAGEFCDRLLGPIGLMIASVAVMISVFGALNGNLLVGPRLLYAMAHDGLAPRPLGELHARYRTPAVAELVLTAWAILLVIGSALLVRYRLPVLPLGTWQLDLNLPAGTVVFNVLTDYAMFGAVWFETLAVASIFVFRHRYPPERVHLPYRCWGYPWLPLIYVTVMALVLINMFVTNRTEALIGVGFVAAGAVVYFVKFGRGTPEPASEAAPPPIAVVSGE